MQAMRFNFRTLCRNAAERGGQMQQRLLEALDARHNVKTLPEFGIERTAQLAGCTANHLRNLEQRGDLPNPGWSKPAPPSGVSTTTTKSTGSAN